MGRIVFGIVLSFVLAPVVLLAWLYFGHPPVAVADPPLPYEQWMTNAALRVRIDHEMPTVPPMQADEENFVAGAKIYRDQCASCHGFHVKPSTFGAYMFPAAPPLWEKHQNSAAVGVSDDPAGETFWKVDNGIRLSGMPAFHNVLTATQIWQVSLLLASADKPLPPEAVAIVRGEQAPAASKGTGGARP